MFDVGMANDEAVFLAFINDGQYAIAGRDTGENDVYLPGFKLPSNVEAVSSLEPAFEKE